MPPCFSETIAKGDHFTQFGMMSKICALFMLQVFWDKAKGRLRVKKQQ
jgi:hypothetical protein